MYVGVAAVSFYRWFPAVHSLGSSSCSCCHFADVSCCHSRTAHVVVRWMASHAHLSYGKLSSDVFCNI